jgi:hypothetical protein
VSDPRCRLLLMHPEDRVRSALALRADGLEATEIGRRLGVPKSTVQYWCRGGRRKPRRSERDPCSRCDGRELDPAAYAYLLGQYLGDGHIVKRSDGAVALWIYCADDWPGVSTEVEKALKTVMPTVPVRCTRRSAGCHALVSNSRHWICLFPQHGPGMKHTREIALEAWQGSIVNAFPGPFVRGLIHSDGCRITNWATKRGPGGTKRYEYPRYMFSNKSEHILALFEAALDALGVAHRRPRRDLVSVARRADVARLDEFVGPKY